MANTSTSERGLLTESGIDGLAIKPTETDVDALAVESGVSDGGGSASGTSPAITRSLADAILVVDFEGAAAVPAEATLRRLADSVGQLRLTTPVRADGFDPLGDDSRSSAVPDALGRVFVAGHPAYLDGRERQRPIAPRLRTAVADADDPWVGTEGVERLALAAGGTQFELCSPTVEDDVRALRAAGFDGGIAVYAPTVVSTDEDQILDAVGEYIARRGEVRDRLPDDVAADATATGKSRRILSNAARQYALVGDRETVRQRTDALREAGVDHVVAYPAAGLDSLVK